MEAALRSALDQDYPDFEVIVADDCSIDGTPDLIREVLESHVKSGVARLSKNDHNLGLVGNWNQAIGHATGEILVAMAGDDISLPGRLRRIQKAFSDNPAAAAVVSQVSVIDSQGRILIPEFEPPALRPRETFIRRDPRLSAYAFGSNVPVIGASAAYRARLAKDFDPITKGKSEDNVFFYRALLAGGVCYVPEALVLWRWHGRNVSLGAELSGEDAAASNARQVSARECELTICEQFRLDAGKARALGMIDERGLRLELRRIMLLERFRKVCLASIDPGHSPYALVKAVWIHLVGERFAPAAIGFSVRSLIKSMLPMSVRMNLNKRLR